MSIILKRRPIDLARRAAAVASDAGWVIERWVDGQGGREMSVDEARVDEARAEQQVTECESVSVVVGGGELRGPALLTLAVRREEHPSGVGGFAGVVSEHLPRIMSPPRFRLPRMARGFALVAHLVEHPPRGTLDDLLVREAGLAAGEAVTVLVAVARGLADLHSGGRAGVRLAPRDIGFRDDGCPVLTGVGRLRPFDHAAARDDLDAYAALAATVCVAVGGGRARALLAAATDGVHRSWDDVIRATLRTADPTAIAWTSSPRARAPVPPVGAEGGGPWGAEPWGSERWGSGDPSGPSVSEFVDGARWVSMPGSLPVPSPIPSDRRGDLEATVRREVARAAASSAPTDGAWELEATVRRDSVRALVARNEDPRAAMPGPPPCGGREADRTGRGRGESSGTLRSATGRWDGALRERPARPAAPRSEMASETVLAEVVRSEVVRSEVVRPEVVRPEVVRPEVVRPEVVRPEVVRSEVVRPDTQLSGGERADAACCGGERADATRAGGERADVTRSGRQRADAAQPEKGPAHRARREAARSPSTHEMGGRSRSAPHQASGRTGTAGDRALVVLERALDELGDRPVGRAMRFVRGWAAARPLVVAVAVAPVLSVLLALLLIPAGEGQGSVVGRSSSALSHEGDRAEPVNSELMRR